MDDLYVIYRDEKGDGNLTRMTEEDGFLPALRAAKHLAQAHTDEMQVWARGRRVTLVSPDEGRDEYANSMAELAAEEELKSRNAVGDCQLCGEPVGPDEQAEVVERATGKHLHPVHAEGCHDALETFDGNTDTKYTFA